MTAMTHIAIQESLNGRPSIGSKRSATSNTGECDLHATEQRQQSIGNGSPTETGNKPMRATIMYRAGDVRIENVPDVTITNPTDALIRIARACICGSDLWPYNELEATEAGRRMGHEAVGVVEAVGADVHTVKRGDVVVMPFAYSDGTRMFCDEGLQTSCVHGGFFGV
jgi:hypothetical protein